MHTHMHLMLNRKANNHTPVSALCAFFMVNMPWSSYCCCSNRQTKEVEEMSLRVTEKEEELEKIRTMFNNKQCELDACIKILKETKVPPDIYTAVNDISAKPQTQPYICGITIITFRWSWRLLPLVSAVQRRRFKKLKLVRKNRYTACICVCRVHVHSCWNQTEFRPRTYRFALTRTFSVCLTCGLIDRLRWQWHTRRLQCSCDSMEKTSFINSRKQPPTLMACTRRLVCSCVLPFNLL